MEQLWTFIHSNAPKVLLSVIVAIVGAIAIRLIKKITDRALKRSTLIISAHKIILQILDIILKFILILIIAETLGIKTTSLITVFGAIGIAISLALKDSLSNVAGGLLVLFSDPFEKGDFIETNGVSGTVDNISLFYTTLKTPDNKTVFVPNGEICTAKITNYSTEKTRRLDLVFPIAYNADVDKALSIIKTEAENSGFMIEGATTFKLGKLGDSAIELYSRFWVESKNYWTAYFYMLENVKKAFDTAGIEIPFNQLDVHLDTIEKK
jgi:small conductance mechanosensitive channel